MSEAEPRYDAAPYAPSRFGDRAADEAWLRHTIAQIPSGTYRVIQD